MQTDHSLMILFLFPQHRLLVRQCRSGESFQIRTRKFATPYVIVAPPVDLLDREYELLLRSDIVHGLFARRVSVLLAHQQYGELDAFGDRLRIEKLKFLSSSSKLAAHSAIAERTERHVSDTFKQKNYRHNHNS